MPSLLDARRAAAAFVAVAMSAALIAFAFILSDSFRTQMQAEARLSIGGADIVVASGRQLSSTDGHLDDALVSRLADLDGIASVRGEHWGILQLDLPRQLAGTVGSAIMIRDVPVLSQYTTLAAGRLPIGTGEVAIDTRLAEQQGLGVGDTIRLKNGYDRGTSSTNGTGDADGTDDIVHTSPTIVGVVSPGADAGLDKGTGGTVYATVDQFEAMGAITSYNHLYVTAKPGTSTGALVDEVAETVRAVRPGAFVVDADDAVAERAASAQSGGTMVAMVLNLLTPVCAVVAGIVIATTFTTLVARQNRTIGLVRCIGASRRQIMLAVLRTAVVTGTAGSVVGVIAGTAGAALLIRSGVIENLDAHLTISPVSLAGAVVLGTLVTLAAVLRPAHRATRISPLVALSGSTVGAKRVGRGQRLAAITGLIIALAGAVLVVPGTTGHNLYIVAGGAVLVVLGLLAALPLLVSLIVGLIGRAGSDGRYPILHLAARNLVRNPGRSAATAATLLVCVLVGSVLFVGLFSFNSSFQSIVNQGSPTDITVFGVTPQTDTAALTSTVESTDGVESTTLVPSLDLTQTVDGATDSIDVLSINASAVAPVVRSTKGLEDLDDRTLIVGELYRIPDGTAVTLTGPAGDVELTARVREGWGAAITPATAERLTGGEPTDAIMWVRTTGAGSSESVENAVRQATRGQDLMVRGSAEGRNEFTDLMHRTVFTICLVMAAALIIALSGLANTTDVSVLERTREIGLLRATGTDRSQVRRLIVIEASLLALIGGVLGVVIGTALGAAGTLAVLSDGGISVFIPYLPLAGVLAVTLLVGVAAALRPAGRAGRVTPVTALATD